MWTLLIGAFIGLAVAMVVGAVLQSWIVLLICAIPLILVGVFLGFGYELGRYHDEIVDDPDMVDKRAEYHITKREYNQAASMYLHGVAAFRSAARQSETNCEALEAQADAWRKKADDCRSRHLDDVLGNFRRQRR